MTKFEDLTEDQMKKRLSTLFRGKRKELGIGLIALSETIGINKTTLVRIENGTALPKIPVARKLAHELELDPAEVLCMSAGAPAPRRAATKKGSLKK